MAKKWYVIHTYSGYENKAKVNLEERAKNLGMAASFSEILVPTETVVELVKGKKKTSQRKIFPGYILVKMELNNETWHIVKGTPKVTGFAGEGAKPIPIPEEEVVEVIAQIKEGVTKAKPKVSLGVGEGEGIGEHFREINPCGTRFYSGGKELSLKGLEYGEKSNWCG